MLSLILSLWLGFVVFVFLWLILGWMVWFWLLFLELNDFWGGNLIGEEVVFFLWFIEEVLEFEDGGLVVSVVGVDVDCFWFWWVVFLFILFKWGWGKMEYVKFYVGFLWFSWRWELRNRGMKSVGMWLVLIKFDW